VWQALREEFHAEGFELVTVGLDTLGAQACRPFIEAANPSHPSLIDQHHVMADLFGIVNIPEAVWINEEGMIVRPAEAAPPPPMDGAAPTLNPPAELPQHMMDIMGEAVKIQSDPAAYHHALKDWVEKGANSEYALDPETVIARSEPRDKDKALGHAHFEMASHLETEGQHDLAIKHFREAHRLVPESWTFRRQAWSLERVGDGPFARFWQGPSPDKDWPYEGDWLTDIRREGPENYYSTWKG